MESFNKKIIILSSHKPTNYFLINELSKKYNVACVIYENRSLSKKAQLVWRRIKKLGLLKVIGQLNFIFFSKIFISDKSLDGIKKPILNSTDVKDINEQEVEKLIKEVNPRLIVVSGVSIIKSNILSLSKTFINIHCGITPKYRGVHGGFWAIYNRDFDNIGVTVHLVDKGVDTGKILYSDKIIVNSRDNFKTIVTKQYLKGTELMIRAVADTFNDSLKIINSFGESHLWYHPTIIEYIKWLEIFKNEFH